jgi:uncharacterized protein YbjT (DUF2867 family)
VKGWCVLRSQFYAQNLLLYREQIQEGHLPLPIGPHAKFAPIDVEDVGQAAKHILLDPEKHHGKYYTITGPHALTGPEMAESCSKVLGRPVKFQDISITEAKKILRTHHIPATEVQGLLEFYEVVKDGEMGMVTQDFESVTGDVPSTLEDFFTKHKEELTTKSQ